MAASETTQIYVETLQSLRCQPSVGKHVMRKLKVPYLVVNKCNVLYFLKVLTNYIPSDEKILSNVFLYALIWYDIRIVTNRSIMPRM